MLRGPGDTAPYRFLHAWVPTLFRVVFRMRVTGTEHVPAEGGVLLAANHRSNVDPVFIGAACPRQVHFMAKAELWSFKPLGRLIDVLGSFPVHRGSADRAAVKQALGYLGDGAVVGLFPEGHRQKDGRLGHPQPGVSLFALRPGVTTIPVALEGTERILRNGIPRLPRIEIHFGPPIDTEVPGVSKSVRQEEVAGRIMRALGRLLGQRWAPATDGADSADVTAGSPGGVADRHEAGGRP